MEKIYILSYKEKRGTYNFYSTIINAKSKKEVKDIFNKKDNKEKKYNIVQIRRLE